MRRLVFWVSMLVGAASGALIAWLDDLAVLIGMTLIGAVVGTVFGAVLTGIGARVRGARRAPDEMGYRAVSEERDRNYWRDKGHPPFMKPSDALHDRHMLDPDRLD